MLKILSSTIALIVSAPAFAGGVMDCWLHKSDCKELVGKRFWIRPMGPESSLEIKFSQGEPSKLRAGSIVVSAANDDGHYGIDLTVKLPDGRTGWISNGSAHLLSPTDPVADTKKAAEQAQAKRQDCERRGQPKIGMTPAELVETCWRQPIRIVKKTTGAGIEESFVYGIGHIVKLTDGKVSEIIEAR